MHMYWFIFTRISTAGNTKAQYVYRLGTQNTRIGVRSITKKALWQQWELFYWRVNQLSLNFKASSPTTDALEIVCLFDFAVLQYDLGFNCQNKTLWTDTLNTPAWITLFVCRKLKREADISCLAVLPRIKVQRYKGWPWSWFDLCWLECTWLTFSFCLT